MTREELSTMNAIQNINRKLPDIELRDLVAISVIKVMDNDLFDDDYELKARAEYCYKVADAMLEARKK